MANTGSSSSADAQLDSAVPSDADVTPEGRPGRKPKGRLPVVIPETSDGPDPNHVPTWRQRMVLQIIRESVQQRGYPPSMREIADAAGLASTGSVSYQLSTLQKKGVPALGRRTPADGRGAPARPPGGAAGA